MSFPLQVREDALVASGRHCCLCHKFCGIKIELHHVVHTSEGGQDTFENCIPLCFECHADMRSYDHKHPKGSKYTLDELRRHRDNWYAKVTAAPGTRPLDQPHELDRAAYRWIVSSLPYEGVIGYVEAQDFGAPFKRSRLEPLDSFLDKCCNPELEFLDTDLEGMRAKLIEDIKAFGHYWSMHTWPMDSNVEYQAVPREWEDRQPQRFVETIDRINELSRQVVYSYTALVREARRRLGV